MSSAADSLDGVMAPPETLAGYQRNLGILHRSIISRMSAVALSDLAMNTSLNDLAVLEGRYVGVALVEAKALRAENEEVDRG